MNEKFIEENYDTQNTKNEQQKDLCITSEQLTEQWKKGELPYGRYYVELAYNGNSIIMAEYWWDKTLTLDDHEYSREEVKRILAPVPSYEEWIGVKQQRDLENKLRHDSDNKNWQLRTENQQLKELLKECIPYFNALVEKRLKLEYIPQVYELLSKINEVLK